VHLVLARLPDAPARHQGHLAVHRAQVQGRQATARMGERNSLRCGSIEHKMGIHGSATCVMNFDGAEGWLIGEPRTRACNAMFTMMNTARWRSACRASA
jgi:alkylation response protein AidB-like acyl-CoA dehydrogenase